jgi:hypothetical protein
MKINREGGLAIKYGDALLHFLARTARRHGPWSIISQCPPPLGHWAKRARRMLPLAAARAQMLPCC